MLLDFEASHAACYNQLIEVVKNNLLLGDWYALNADLHMSLCTGTAALLAITALGAIILGLR